MRLWRWQGKPELNLEVEAEGVELVCKMIPGNFFFMLLSAEKRTGCKTWFIVEGRRPLEEMAKVVCRNENPIFNLLLFAEL